MINKELLKSLSRCCLLRHPCTAMTNGAEMSNAQLGKILPLSRTSPRLNNLGEHTEIKHLLLSRMTPPPITHEYQSLEEAHLLPFFFSDIISQM